jgi:hypothetical protein
VVRRKEWHIERTRGVLLSNGPARERRPPPAE